MAIMNAATQLVLVVVFLLAPSTTMASHHGSHGGSHTTKHSPPPRPSPISPAPPSVLPIPIMAPPSAAAALVRATCNSTTYPSLCVSALAADPSSATADLRGLSAASNASASAAALGVGANDTTGTAQGGAAGGDAQAAAMVMRTCAGKYGEARDALAAARGSIEERDYDYAAVHVSAAAEYPRVCRALFFRAQRRQSSSSSPAPAPVATFPAELATREAALGQLCSVALDIIALLNTTN